MGVHCERRTYGPLGEEQPDKTQSAWLHAREILCDQPVGISGIYNTDCGRGKNMDIVLLDFAKAFDKVPKERLLAKLTANGVGGKVLQWVRNRQEAASGTKWRNLRPD